MATAPAASPDPAPQHHVTRYVVRRATMTRGDEIAAALEDARGRDKLGAFIGVAECYCENPRCPRREIAMVIKELDGQLGGSLCCPNCRGQLKSHRVLTHDEKCRDDKRSARVSVRRQLYERRHPDEGVPLSAVPDVSLDALIARVVADEAST